MKLLLSSLVFICLSCAPSLPLVFTPEPTPDAATIYSNGIPQASVVADSLAFFLSMDQASDYGGDYFRLWVQCENLSEWPALLDPSKTFILIAVPRQTSGIKQEFTMEAESPESFSKRPGISDLASDLLRKNTLFKNQGVNGYVYFRQNLRTYSKSGRSVYTYDPGEFDYKLIVQLPGGNRVVEFKTTQGE
jgi:hypothetical protein